MTSRDETDEIDWLRSAIRRLPYDKAVPDRTPGYNNYNTQKDRGAATRHSGHGLCRMRHRCWRRTDRLQSHTRGKPPEPSRSRLALCQRMAVQTARSARPACTCAGGVDCIVCRKLEGAMPPQAGLHPTAATGPFGDRNFRDHRGNRDEPTSWNGPIRLTGVPTARGLFRDEVGIVRFKGGSHASS